MSRLMELIEELCPDGVEYKKLGEVLKIKNGKDYKGFGEGNIPVYGTGGIMTYIDTYAHDKPSVLIPRKGSIDKLYYVEEPFWTVDTIFYTDININIISPKYVFYYLKTQHLEKLNTAGGVPSLTQSVLNKVVIPLPPLEIQEEIVRILDNFTELTGSITKELTAELTARRKEYEYYRDTLLTFGDDVGYKELGEVSEMKRGTSITKETITIGNIPVISGGKEPAYYCNKYNRENETITIAGSGAGAGYVQYWNMPIFVCDSFSIKGIEDVLTKYLYYCLINMQEKIYLTKKGSGVPHVHVSSIEKFKIPIPPLAEQQRIVEILDRFDAVCNDITIGLPAEIEARRKQYEYYRDKLLTFKEAKA